MTSRRVFLKNGGLALLSLGVAPSFLTRTVRAQSRRRKILVAVFQRGAVDGLNMVVPYGERDYYRARPTIAVDRPGNGTDTAVNLDGFFGLHPRMAPLEPFFARNDLAVVHACGSHDSTRSHFDAQDYMESATPGRKGTRDGWLNRYLQDREREHATAFQAVALAGRLPRALQGTAPALAMRDISRFGLRAGAANGLRDAFEMEYAAAADAVLGGAGRDAFDAIDQIEAADPTRYAPDHGALYPPTPFGEALKQIAQLIKADVGLEVAFTESGNWDHHVNEGGATGLLAGRLDDLARGLAALATDLARPHGRRAGAHDVGVRSRGRRERERRHRPRSRKRDAGAGWRRAGRACLRHVARSRPRRPV